MRDFGDITIARAIVHLVAAREGRCTLSDRELALKPRVADFLTKHVAAGLADTQATAANFLAIEDEKVSGACQQLLNTDASLVALSQRIARRLYEVQAGDQRISDGTLCVLLCAAEDGKKMTRRFLALLKLEPSDGFKAVDEVDENGRTIVDLVVETDVLPGNRQRLQKCAFVRIREPDDEYEILVVDRQDHGRVASFFPRDFLEAEPWLDAMERTKRLYRSLLKVKNEVQSDLLPTDRTRFDNVVRGAMDQVSINLDELVTTLPGPPEVRAQVASALSDVLPDREFDLDPAVAERFVRRRVFEGDHELRVAVRADAFDDMITVTDDDEGYHIVTIRTRKWKEKALR